MVDTSKQGEATDLLTKLSEDYEEVLTNGETLTQTNKDLTERNEKLREVNSKLFLKVGEIPNKENNNNNNNNEDNGNTEPLQYEALFNQKGELI